MTKNVLQNTAYVVLTISAVVLAWGSVTGRGLLPDQGGSGIEPMFGEGAVLPAITLFAPPADTVPAAAADQETLIVFFATSCPHCLASLPTYRKVASTRCDLTMTFVIRDLPADKIASWWSENAWEQDAPEVCAAVRVGTAVSSLSSFGQIPTPTHYLVDQEGEVLVSGAGSLLDVPAWLSVEAAADPQ